MRSTTEAVRRELGRGPLVYRYLGEDGLRGSEGVFVCCSFWLVEALALANRHQEAAQLMEAMLDLATTTHEFLGNFPQGLVHLALISAAAAFHGDGA